MVCSQDKRLVPGGGATEIELAKQITSYGEVQPMSFLTSNFLFIYLYIHTHTYLNMYVTYTDTYMLFYTNMYVC